MKTTTKQENNPAQKWLVFKTAAGEITGYVEGFLGRGGRYVTIPGASRSLDPNDPKDMELIASLGLADASIARQK
jgi:hypothetical protein